MTLRADGGPQLGGANTWTGQQTFNRGITVTQGMANEAILASTGYSLTGSNTTPMLNLAGTWNTSGLAFGIKLNITDTASNSASALMDLQVGGVSKFSVNKSGAGTYASTITVTGNILGLSDVRAGATNFMYFTGRSIIGSSADGIISIQNNAANSGAALDLMERTAPSAPAANTGRLYTEDNGAGKTRLMILFASGAAQQIAIEP